MKLPFGRNKDVGVAASYLSSYGLSIPPFATQAEGPFLFLDAERQQYLDMLQHLTQYSDEVLLVCGERGVGKTTICQEFFRRAEEHWRCCHIDGAQGLEADRLFAKLAECYELDLTGLAPDQLLAGLQAQLNALQEQRLAVLLIDSAHLLSDDALEIILHLGLLEGEHGRLIRLVLFSDPDISVRLNGPRFANLPPAHRIDLKGLSEDDTAGYLQQRMQAAGLAGALPLDSGDLRHIYRASHGMPALINQQAHQLLQNRHQRGVGRPNRQTVKLGIAATAIIGTVLGLQGRVSDMLSGDTQAVSVGAVERPVIRLSEAAQPWAVVIRDGESIQISCGASGPDTVGVRPTLSTAALSQPTTIINRPMLAATQAAMLTEDEAVKVEEVLVDTVVDEQEERADDSPLLVAEASATRSEEIAEPVPLQLNRVEPSPVIARQQAQRLLVHGQGFVEGSRIALSRAGQIEVLSDEQVTILDSNTLAIQIETGDSAAGWAIQLSSLDERRSNVLRFQVVSQQRLPSEQTALVSSQPSESQPTPPVNVTTTPAPSATAVKPETTGASRAARPPASQQVAATSGLLDTHWLASQPAENYTVQLFASAEHETIKNLVAQGTLPQPLAEFAMQRDGKPLYVLTHGSYPDRAEAERVSAGIGGGIQAWIRSIGSVQEVMEAVSVPATSTVAIVDTALSGIKDDPWVWSQNPAHHTIQLAAASSEQAISEAMAGMALPGERVVVKTIRNGQPWFVLIYGTFANKASAKDTIDRLPAAQRNAGPWTRSFASLQDEMSRSNR